MKYLLTIIITTIIVGGGMYQWHEYVLENKNKDIVTAQKEIKNEMKKLQEKLNDNASVNNNLQIFETKNKVEEKKYKDYILHDLVSKIPENWSSAQNINTTGSTRLSKPTGSIASASISYDDFNIEQVDFYFANSDIINKLKKQENEKLGTWKEKVIGGVIADVFVYNLDEEKDISKENSGAKKYFIPLSRYFKTLVIHKQAKGDEEFEEEFEKFLDSILFVKN